MGPGFWIRCTILSLGRELEPSSMVVSVTDLNIDWSHIYWIGILEKEWKESWVENMFEEVMAQSPPYCKKHINFQIWEAEQILGRSLWTKLCKLLKIKVKEKNNISTENIDKNGSCFFIKTVEAWILENAHTLIPRTWEYVTLHDKRDFADFRVTDLEMVPGSGGQIIQVDHLQSHKVKYNF